MTKKQKLAEQLAQQPGICWTDEQNTYLVPSQKTQRKYVVRNLGWLWTCTCPDNQFRKRDCKHIIAAKLWLEKMPDYKPITIEDPLHVIACPFCKSVKFTKDGSRKTSLGRKQRYFCHDCNKRFIDEIVKNIKGNSELLTKAMDLYFKGISYRSISDHFKQFYGFKISPITLYRWLVKFCKIMERYSESLCPNVSTMWHLDEQFLKAHGNEILVWNAIDRETRLLIAAEVTSTKYIKDARKVFRKIKKTTGIRPQAVVTDGNPAYIKSLKKEYHSHRIPKIRHVISGINKGITNNRIERYHNTFRERDKVMRGFHSVRSAQRFADGFRLYNNFVRPNMTLGGVTPAQAAGIDLGYARNRWHELLAKSMNGDMFTQKRKLKRFNGYTMRIWDHDGKEIGSFQRRKFKTRFDSKEKAQEFLNFYSRMFPELVFFVEKKCLV